MYLSPAERDRLLIHTAARLAHRRLARGLLLNAPEATAIVSATVIETARDGRTLDEAVAAGRNALGVGQVLPGVPNVVRRVQVEALFDDGTRLAVIEEPFGPPSMVGPGSVLPAVAPDAGQPTWEVVLHVTNTAASPITVSSHFHFFESNRRLRFDRATAYGMRLAIDAGSAVRFGPGETVTVPLVPLRGARVVVGYGGLVDGPLDAPGMRAKALVRARERGYLGVDESD